MKKTKTNNKEQELVRCNIAGVQYGDYQQINGKFKVGDQVELFAEKTNKFDPRAIRVEYKGHKLGYIPSTMLTILHDSEDNGFKVKAYLSSYNTTNPTWAMFCLRVVQYGQKPVRRSEPYFSFDFLDITDLTDFH